MPISKGSAYGEPGKPLPPHGIVVADDRAASQALEDARRQNRPFPPIRLDAGDLCRTLGGPTPNHDLTFTVDVGEVLIDGRIHLFVAHLVARTRTWSYAFVAMNAQWRNQWNLGPRAHPNDGRLDTYEARLPSPADRIKIARRLRLGAHLPHPAVKERRTEAIQVDLPKSLTVELDGEPAPTPKARTLAIRIRPDALTVVV